MSVRHDETTNKEIVIAPEPRYSEGYFHFLTGPRKRGRVGRKPEIGLKTRTRKRNATRPKRGRRGGKRAGSGAAEDRLAPPRGRSVGKFLPDAGFYRVFAAFGEGATYFLFTRLFTGGMSSAVLCGHVKLAVWAISAAKSDKKTASELFRKLKGRLELERKPLSLFGLRQSGG